MIRIRVLLLCIATLAFGVTSVSATMRIADDTGGQISRYLKTFAIMRSTGERVVVDGSCLSACTLVLGLIPHDQICATRRARFGFHVAWMQNMDGNLVPSPIGTQKLWSIYPTSVRRWINQHGGLSREMIFMEGRSLDGIVPTCDRQTVRALLLQQSAGYSGTLAQPILPQFISSPYSVHYPAASTPNTIRRNKRARFRP
jgi:hypothetical protein